MEIILENIGRRFNQEWIFRSLNYRFERGQAYAILGANGSGKSTLLQVLAGSLSASEGSLTYQSGETKIESDDFYEHISIAAPYLDLIEEFSLAEMIDFHFQFKDFLPGFDSKEIIRILDLKKVENKSIRYFSSGMKQRCKLALAVFTNTPVLLLDEPTANLDKQGIEWYQHLVANYTKERLLIICSNQEEEYKCCTQQLQISDYKNFDNLVGENSN
jgi:ABC-type multidrug transport system ATPase subunit